MIVVLVVAFVVTTNLAAISPTPLVVSLRVSLLVPANWTRNVLHDDLFSEVLLTRHRLLSLSKIENFRALQKAETFTLCVNRELPNGLLRIELLLTFIDWR